MTGFRCPTLWWSLTTPRSLFTNWLRTLTRLSALTTRLYEICFRTLKLTNPNYGDLNHLGECLLSMSQLLSPTPSMRNGENFAKQVLLLVLLRLKAMFINFFIHCSSTGSTQRWSSQVGRQHGFLPPSSILLTWIRSAQCQGSLGLQCTHRSRAHSAGITFLSTFRLFTR